jgi:propane monooxygenase coupling protein
VTSFKTAESPFKSDSTASNMCGFTLMNSQVGVLISRVLERPGQRAGSPTCRR